MRVAAIIVSYNDVEQTIKFVNNIRNMELINRIVVVDNKSTDENAYEILSRVDDNKVITVQSERNGGYNYGNNFGLKYLESINEQYDYYIISNPDVYVEEETLKHCLSIIDSDEKTAIIAPRMFDKNDKPIRRSAWKTRTFALDCIHSTRLLELIFYGIFKDGEYNENDFSKERLNVDAISGAFFIMKRSFLEKIKRFDDNVFLFYEEDILAKQVKAADMKIISLNSEKFIHYESQTIGRTFNYFSKMHQLFKSRIYYHKTYNHINMIQVAILYILYGFKNAELLIEVPIRKLLKK